MNPWRLFSFICIALPSAAVYYPSLWHAPRSDQIVYFSVVAPFHSWSSLALSCFDINRWGTYAPGDEKLFRPLVYFFLGNEKYFLGYQFYLWQAVGIVLHLCVVWFVLKLLWRILPGPLAFAISLFFAMLFMNMEMVIWSHVNSYLIFILMTIIVLDQAYAWMAEENPKSWRLWSILACLLISSFVYETANVFVGLIFLFLFKKKNSGMILLPVLAYGVLNGWNAAARHVSFWGPQSHILSRIIPVFEAVGFWLYSGIWPWAIQIYFDARNMIRPESLHPSWAWLADSVAAGGIGFALWTLKALERRFLLLLVAMTLVYAMVIIFGRTQNQSIVLAITKNPHYFYSFWALMVIMIGLIFSALPHRHWLKVALCCVLAGLAVANGYRLYRVNEIQAQKMQPHLVLARAIEMLVQEKKEEKDFSFYVPPDYPGNYAYQDCFGKKTSFIGLLYPQYYRKDHPKYHF